MGGGEAKDLKQIFQPESSPLVLLWLCSGLHGTVPSEPLGLQHCAHLVAIIITITIIFIIIVIITITTRFIILMIIIITINIEGKIL